MVTFSVEMFECFHREQWRVQYKQSIEYYEPMVFNKTILKKKTKKKRKTFYHQENLLSSLYSYVILTPLMSEF